MFFEFSTAMWDSCIVLKSNACRRRMSMDMFTSILKMKRKAFNRQYLIKTDEHVFQNRLSPVEDLPGRLRNFREGLYKIWRSKEVHFLEYSIFRILDGINLCPSQSVTTQSPLLFPFSIFRTSIPERRAPL